jgi:hypothetical protein
MITNDLNTDPYYDYYDPGCIKYIKLQFIVTPTNMTFDEFMGFRNKPQKKEIDWLAINRMFS